MQFNRRYFDQKHFGCIVCFIPLLKNKQIKNDYVYFYDATPNVICSELSMCENHQHIINKLPNNK